MLDDTVHSTLSIGPLSTHFPGEAGWRSEEKGRGEQGEREEGRKPFQGQSDSTRCSHRRSPRGQSG
eukprot:1862188-Pyramimonas_sp.AAC.2